jgi:hypothetical protein
MRLELNKCILQRIRFGEMDMYIFSHPNYFIACEDKVIGHLFAEYERAFMTFTIYNN